MSVGQRSHFLPGGWKARVRAVASTLPGMRVDHTLPRVPPARPVPDDPSILGFPAEVVDDDADEDVSLESVTVTRAASAGRLVVLRRADGVGGLLLVLAGVAAGLSLWMPWAQGVGDTGLSLVRRGVNVLVTGGSALGGSEWWPPLAVVLGGGVLSLLGVLLFVPARTHRFVGLLAFVAAEAAAAGVLTVLADAGWSIARFHVGLWFAVAVPVLGVLGSLKAMLTAPRLPPAAVPPAGSG